MSADASTVSVSDPAMPLIVIALQDSDQQRVAQASTPASVGVAQPLAMPRKITTGANNASKATMGQPARGRKISSVGARA